VHHASQKSSHRIIRQGGRGYESVFLKFRFLGVCSVDKFSERRKRGFKRNLSARWSTFYAKIEYPPMHNLHFTLLDSFVRDIHVELVD
jgi:hypothetical protein